MTTLKRHREYDGRENKQAWQQEKVGKRDYWVENVKDKQTESGGKEGKQYVYLKGRMC